ncbi:enoyl-CoA hydratase/isomerase family protein [Vibrio sp. 404]|uniref:Enoyl-CoA hydratase/isomerase family protein n=1 Tax=Vibrio marinisediminis TaxID=2758441 RepID=A0A7W2IUA1_9VIBR|nr:enoyl-CoA hydratase-related protein [Vibrio marinisediminis]MBA5763164.1 enoyl-CoA hydratase/isomerase family protein [Vibrio marinisediminis]
MTGLLLEKESNGVAWLSLNRPEKHNAFDDQLIASLIETLDELNQDNTIKVLVLSAKGKHFSAGADLGWMQSMASKSESENQQDAQQLAMLLHKLDTFSKPTIAMVHGAAFGGALGLICCCDIAIGTPDSRFCLSEVKLGLLPATIGPYVIRTIGQRQSRRYFLTAELIDADTAHNLEILHHISYQPRELVNSIIAQLNQHGPNALQASKALCLQCHNHPIDDTLIEYTSQAIAAARVSQEGQEGLAAFFAKRPANWRNDV